jgi:hypothetical protein
LHNGLTLNAAIDWLSYRKDVDDAYNIFHNLHMGEVAVRLPGSAVRRFRQMVVADASVVVPECE